MSTRHSPFTFRAHAQPPDHVQCVAHCSSCTGGRQHNHFIPLRELAPARKIDYECTGVQALAAEAKLKEAFIYAGCAHVAQWPADAAKTIDAEIVGAMANAALPFNLQ